MAQTSYFIGQWVWSNQHSTTCQVIDIQQLWGHDSCRVWLPTSNRVLRLAAEDLTPLAQPIDQAADAIIYRATAARIADLLSQDTLLAPIETTVIPLPHQLRALTRAVAQEQVRYLLADEVGLGKTIEAGLILRELKLRGLVRRVLVVAPKGLVTQWVAELATHFHEQFTLITPSTFPAYRQLARDGNLWRSVDQVVCSLDAVKPLESRRGWTPSQVAAYNRERFDDLIAAGWDLVIVDEAHRLGGSTDQIARYRLGQGLAAAAPYLLLLSATPHQGKSDAFQRLLALLDPQAFPDAESVTRARVRPYLIRTEKRQAIDAKGQPLFKPRVTTLQPVAWHARHHLQADLYAAVTDYVRAGYNQALQEKRNYVGFLMVLMQWLVTSSTTAIRTTLERRLAVLTASGVPSTNSPAFGEDWEELDGQEQADTFVALPTAALRNEIAEVELLLDLAQRCEATAPDAKAEALLDLIYSLQQSERALKLKVLIFTEFVPTQAMLQRFLAERGFAVVCLNGAMDLAERQRVQADFAQTAQVLISTDAGGEGLNLQFCHVVVNYDLPWNPMRLEQRIGRVDRIGQRHIVRAINFVFENTVEHRVREVLEEKLALIRTEFGVDKTGDVLDSAQAGALFDDLYLATLLDPTAIEAKVASVVHQIKEQTVAATAARTLLETTESLEPQDAQRIVTHPLPVWVERMTVTYLRSHNGQAEMTSRGWRLQWPDGEEQTSVRFAAQVQEDTPVTRVLTVEDERIRRLLAEAPPVVPGQPIPQIALAGLPTSVQGYWSLWRIGIGLADRRRQRTLPLFLHNDGRALAPTARRLWDLLLAATPQLQAHQPDETGLIYQKLYATAVFQGKVLYDELSRSHDQQIQQELAKGEYAFAARRRAIERIGLPEVRNYRLAHLAQEETAWHQEMTQRA